MNIEPIIIPDERIIESIFLIRGRKVMIDQDLAKLYNVTTGNLNKAVKRNIRRFPVDFMFSLTEEEVKLLIFQFGRSNAGRGGNRRLPYAFTEQGVAMLSSVLKSEKAVQMNIQIIRTFTRLRQVISENKSFANEIEKMEKKYDKHIAEIFRIIKFLVKEKEKPKEKIGFKI